MLTRIYIGIWLFTWAVVLTVYFTGYLSAVTVIGLGIVFQALVFIGMIAVLPSMVGHEPNRKLENRKA